MAGNNKAPQPAYEIKHDDNTAVFERDILKENAARLPYLTRLFAYVFGSAKAMCGVFLGLAVFLSLLQRPWLLFGGNIRRERPRRAIDVTFPQMLSPPPCDVVLADRLRNSSTATFTAARISNA